jgi:dienelactone hydrolase
LKKVLLVAGLAVTLVLVALGVWVGRPYRATSVAMAAMENATTSEGGGWFAFYPDDPHTVPEVGIIIYPGGLVEAEAYAAIAEQLAEQGQALVVVKRMPFNLAILDADGASEVIAAFPEVDHWIVGGHSLGGSAAAIFADDNSRVEGLLLWASYPPDGNDLSNDSFRVVSIYGSRDTVLNRQNLDESRARLPDEALFVEIEGATHAFFGDYGEQRGDGEPGLSREAAQQEIVEASLAVLEHLGNP